MKSVQRMKEKKERKRVAVRSRRDPTTLWDDGGKPLRGEREKSFFLAGGRRRTPSDDKSVGYEFILPAGEKTRAFIRKRKKGISRV